MSEPDSPAPAKAPGFVDRLRGFRVEIGLAGAAVAGSLLVYAPYVGRMGTVYRKWDAPDYLTVARTLYRIQDDNPLLAYVYEKTYFWRHLPLYPLLVRLFSFIGYQRALLFVSVAAGVALVILFYRLARDVWKLPSPGFLSLVLLFLPPTWLLHRSVGASESTYLLLAVASIALFQKGRVGWASLLAGLATVTRFNGIMIAPAFGLLLLQRKEVRKLPWLSLVFLPLLLYFGYSWQVCGNPLEFFAQQSDKLAIPMPFGFIEHLFSLGLYQQVEFYILLALLYAVGIARIRRFEVAFTYCFFQYVFLICVSTEDWSRHWLAMAPFALIMGFADEIAKKEFRFIFPIFVVMSYVYSWRVIELNGCRPDIYSHLIWHLKLMAEHVW